jgi:aminoglycoside phosphotransferase
MDTLSGLTTFEAVVRFAEQAVSPALAARLRDLNEIDEPEAVPVDATSARNLVAFFRELGSPAPEAVTVTADGELDYSVMKAALGELVIRFRTDDTVWVAVDGDSYRGAVQEPASVLMSDRDLLSLRAWL